MNKEDIIRMARESGMAGFDGVVHAAFQLEAFATLVAAAEREAMVAEAAKKGWGMRNDDPFEDCVREIADIRARRQEIDPNQWAFDNGLEST